MSAVDTVCITFVIFVMIEKRMCDDTELVGAFLFTSQEFGSFKMICLALAPARNVMSVSSSH